MHAASKDDDIDCRAIVEALQLGSERVSTASKTPTQELWAPFIYQESMMPAEEMATLRLDSKSALH